MKPKTTLAAVIVTFVAAFVPATAYAGTGSAAQVQADLTQLASDITAAQNALVPDANAITAAAQAGNKSEVKTDVAQFRTDHGNLIPPIQSDRKQLIADFKAARSAGVTGLGAIVKPAVQANQAALQEIRQAAQEAREAVKALREANHGGGTTTTTSTTTTTA